MYNRERRNKSDPKSTLISLAVLLLFLLPTQIIAILVIAAILILPVVFLVIRSKKNTRTASTYKKETVQAFDDCPKTFCFHRDKGEHHLKKGKEIDPWDRPDIDISKYQRK